MPSRGNGFHQVLHSPWCDPLSVDGAGHRGVGAPARRSVPWPTTIERRGDQRFEDGDPAGGQDRRDVKPGSTPRLRWRRD